MEFKYHSPMVIKQNVQYDSPAVSEWRRVIMLTLRGLSGLIQIIKVVLTYTKYRLRGTEAFSSHRYWTKSE